jgi:hypothetical protein
LGGAGVHRSVISVGVALSVAASSVAGPARCQTAAEDIAEKFSNLTTLITAASYISGIGFAVGAIVKFKMHKDNPQQVPIGAPVALVALAASKYLNDTISCPVFVGDSTLLGEDACVWTRFTAGWEGSGGANDSSMNGRVGGQLQIGPGWFLGGALGLGGSQQQTSAGLHQSDRSVDASLVLKRVDGPLFLAGALGISTSSQQYSLAGDGSVYIPGAARNFIAGVRLRGAYEFPFDGWYLRPRTDVDIGFARNSGLQIVAPAATLTIDSASKATVMFTPALEIGGRVDVGPAQILRPYVVAGATYLTDTGTTIGGNFNGYSFSTTSYGPRAILRVEAGLQLHACRQALLIVGFRVDHVLQRPTRSQGLDVVDHTWRSGARVGVARHVGVMCTLG